MKQANPNARSICCPHCRKKVAWKDNPDRPFCSERCRQIDLGNWAAESYRIAGKPGDPLEFIDRQNEEKRQNKEIEG